jgi:hypothetical protein
MSQVSHPATANTSPMAATSKMFPSRLQAAALYFTQYRHLLAVCCHIPRSRESKISRTGGRIWTYGRYPGGADRPRIQRSMRVRVSDPAFTDDLAEELRSRSNAVVEKISEDELEVSLVGSLDVATMQMEIYLRIRAWEAAAEEAGVSVDVIAPTES